MQGHGPGLGTPCEVRSLQAHQQIPDDIHIPPQRCAVALPARGGQHVVHPVAGQVLVHSPICPGSSEAQQLALPCCDSFVHVLQVGVLTVLHLPCSRGLASAQLQQQVQQAADVLPGNLLALFNLPQEMAGVRGATGFVEGMIGKALAGCRPCKRCWPCSLCCARCRFPIKEAAEPRQT